MNFNKCSRCGCFFLSNNDICPNCEPKDEKEIEVLKNYMEENTDYQVDHMSYATGISTKNINRFLVQEQFSNFANQVQKTDLS